MEEWFIRVILVSSSITYNPNCRYNLWNVCSNLCANLLYSLCAHKHIITYNVTKANRYKLAQYVGIIHLFNCIDRPTCTITFYFHVQRFIIFNLIHSVEIKQTIQLHTRTAIKYISIQNCNEFHWQQGTQYACKWSDWNLVCNHFTLLAMMIMHLFQIHQWSRRNFWHFILLLWWIQYYI